MSYPQIASSLFEVLIFIGVVAILFLVIGAVKVLHEMHEKVNEIDAFLEGQFIDKLDKLREIAGKLSGER